MPALGHFYADAARNEKSAAQVDIDFAVPLIHPHPLDRMHLAEHAGGIDEAADRAMSGFDIGDAADDGALAGDVVGQATGSSWCRPMVLAQCQ